MKGDAKQMGNQYLQFAKMIQQAKEARKIKLLDINLKCIDYEGEISTKISRNTGDLSKLKRNYDTTIPGTIISQRDTKKSVILKSSVFGGIKED